MEIYSLRHDMTGDGVYTVSDLWAQVKWWLHLPGELVLSGMLKFTPGLARFFEISLVQCRDAFSIVVSAITWATTYIIWSVLVDWD
ncbi:MAG: hypothetical protein K0S58_1851 [Nitrospira sp.]|nr:hypothetical protein [Nitrospira sp.]